MHYLQIMHNSGLDVAGFTGVPIFQAAGLTVKTKDSRRTPLFLDKNDLDAALGNAYSQRVTQRDQATRAKVDRAHQDLADATKQVPSTVALPYVIYSRQAWCANVIIISVAETKGFFLC